MKNKLHILNRLVCLPLLLVLGLYFVSPSASFKKLDKTSAVPSKASNNTKSSKAELRVAIVAIVQVFHSVFQPIILSAIFSVVLFTLSIVLFIDGFKPAIGFYRHLFTHVIATNAP